MVITNPYNRTRLGLARGAPDHVNGISHAAVDVDGTGNNNSSAQQQQQQQPRRQARPAEIGTPTKPRRRWSNPYAKPSCTTPVRNPYDKRHAPTTAAAAAVSSPVRNPYLKTSPKRPLDSCAKSYTSARKEKLSSSSRRKLSFSTSDVVGGDCSKPAAASSSAVINLSQEFERCSSIIDPDRTYVLYFDGGSRGNPGVAGAGMVMYDGEDRRNEIWHGSQYLGDDNRTNNEAEYAGVITGLDCATRLGVRRILVKGDSKLVVRQVNGEWQCNKPHLRILVQKVVDMRQKFQSFRIVNVYRADNKRAVELANAAMDTRRTDLGALESPRTPPLSQDSDATASESKEKDPIEEICSMTLSQSISDTVLLAADVTEDWTSRLPFLVQYELERLNLRKDLNSCEFGTRVKRVFEEHGGKSSQLQEMISLIYREHENQAAPFEYLLKHSSSNGVAADESDSCLLSFQAKLGEEGMELLPPQIVSVETRRIHRRFGSHRFLDVRCEGRCTESLPVLKSHLKKHLRNNKLLLAGRQYGILYSNPSETQVIFRFFAERGMGISECDRISAPEVASHCIPPELNRGEDGAAISLTKYMKRMQLSFTATIPTIVMKPGMLEEIPDITGQGDDNKNVMTDGCGLISREALNQVYTEYLINREQRSRCLGNSHQDRGSKFSCHYSSFQGRIGGIKGMFVVDDSLEGMKVQYRKSQVKYHVPLTAMGLMSEANDDVLHNTVEVKEFDKEPPPANLSRNIIQTLESRGVPRDYFLSLAKKEISELKTLQKDSDLLMRKYKSRIYLRDSNCLFDDDLFLCMLNAGVNLDEPMMMMKTNDFVNNELKSYREKCRLPEHSSRYLRMLPDHTGLLDSDEAFVAVGEEGAQSEVNGLGSVVAMRLPSYFIGDLRKFKVVSKMDLMKRCQTSGIDPSKGNFFSGIQAALVLSTNGMISQAELMSGGDFDGDKAWVCWNKVVVSNVQECPGQDTAICKQPTDPFKQRSMQWSDPEWSDLIIIYTMQHRNNKRDLGALVKTLESMRDSPRFSDSDADEIAMKAFIQVDNPHTSQWDLSVRKKYGFLRRPHWQATSTGNTYQSTKVLGELYDMLSQAGTTTFNHNETEAEMNRYIRNKIENANPRVDVDLVKEDMRSRLQSFNAALTDHLNLDSSSADDEVVRRSRYQTRLSLRRQYRSDIEKRYSEDDLPLVFAILYEQTYFKSRERMARFHKGPYVFAWEVAHDHLTRIVADGKSKEQGGGIAHTVARGNERISFGKIGR